jgi:hypothetical protein
VINYLYFDESIRDRGGFIVGALVVSDSDLSRLVRDRWRGMGLDSDIFEYKSSSPKSGDPKGQQQRELLRELLHSSRLALTVCPNADRQRLGTHSLSLVSQLLETGLLPAGQHNLYVDQNIAIPARERDSLASRGVSVHPNQDSRIVAGLQVADHAAHALGGMLLEEMGLVRKLVVAGENSGYDPDLEIELGFELWASLRYALLGRKEEVELGDLANAYFRVEGYGLYIAPSCGHELTTHVRKRFGVNYLGCIH